MVLKVLQHQLSNCQVAGLPEPWAKCIALLASVVVQQGAILGSCMLHACVALPQSYVRRQSVLSPAHPAAHGGSWQHAPAWELAALSSHGKPRLMQLHDLSHRPPLQALCLTVLPVPLVWRLGQIARSEMQEQPQHVNATQAVMWADPGHYHADKWQQTAAWPSGGARRHRRCASFRCANTPCLVRAPQSVENVLVLEDKACVVRPLWLS
eukprot:CAMPEP_0183333748 /NCGR_PEP_ID=MMETSP0164_2-20130417/2567_1 /TAXON_ID=221442 /ORGANISM="Coccolithus pelagicus ssp braarudi, Strain PLY182g" /LENGTH=209 /DNA_ID=CAMNT_0025502753 /DNA_START=424 /DNA_END=1050 /DNA_ORIENTATION=+